MVRIEGLGKSDDEQAFRIKTTKAAAIVFYNHVKGLSKCETCNSGKCAHVQILEMHMEMEENRFNWLGPIAYCLDNGSRTSWRTLWVTLTEGLILDGPPYDNILYKHLNKILKNMKISEIGYLWMAGLPEGIDKRRLHPNWDRGEAWLFDSNAFWILLEHGQFITSEPLVV